MAKKEVQTRGWENLMTAADYNLVTKKMPESKKKKFVSNLYNDANAVMSLAGLGLNKNVNENLSSKEIAERRKQIPKHYPWVKPSDIKPYKPEK